MVQLRQEQYISIEIQHRREMEGALDAAVDSLSEQARVRKQGLVVTRTGPTTFTVGLHAGIPYGSIHEHLNW